jgi:riboflavin-specific deaminase-like protein
MNSEPAFPRRPLIERPGEAPTDRPWVVVNMAMTADGKIAPVTDEVFVLGSRADWQRMDQLRAQADAILNGARTIRRDDPPVRVRSASLREERVRAGQTPTPINVIVTNSRGISPQARIIHEPGAQVWVFHPAAVREKVALPADLLNVALYPCDEHAVSIGEVLRRLGREGVRVLLAEGGGELNWSLLEGDWVDELFLTVVPRLLGGREAPTPFGGRGLGRADMRELALVACQPCGDEVFLHYRRRRKAKKS